MAGGDSTPKQVSISRTPSQDIDFADNREETPEMAEGVGISTLFLKYFMFQVYRRNFSSTQRQSSRHNASELADQTDSDPGEVSARELSRQERDLYRSRAQDQQKAGTSVWKYIGIGFLLIVLVSFLVFLNRNAQNQQLGDEI